MASGRPRTRGVRPLAWVVCVALASFLHCGQGSQGSECGLPCGNGSRGAGHHLSLLGRPELLLGSLCVPRTGRCICVVEFIPSSYFTILLPSF